MDDVFITIAVVGATELVKRLRDQDYWTSLIIISAVLIGALAGSMNIDGLNITQGITAGLTATGLITVAKKIG